MLFKNESVCAICGGKTGFFKTVIKDGKICPDCRKLLSKNIAGLKLKTVDDIKRHLEYRKQNEVIFKGFNVTGKAGKRLFENRINKRFYVATDDKKCAPDVFDFSQLVDYRIEEDCKNNKDIIRSIKIVLTVRSEWIQTVTIPIINTETHKGSKLHKLSKPILESCVNILDGILAYKEPDAPALPDGPSIPISASDEILKFENLRDARAITEDEFAAEKKQLLG